MKYITFLLENGDLYGLPLKLVAAARAKYYAERDSDTTFEEEFDYVMNDDSEGLDWFYNNQDPEDFRDKYVLLRKGDPGNLFDRIRNPLDTGIRDF